MGPRRGDLLPLNLSNLHNDGIHVLLSNTKLSSGRRLMSKWDKDDEARKLVDKDLRTPMRRNRDNRFFVTFQGGFFVDAQARCNAFDGRWQRFMDKVMEDR